MIFSWRDMILRMKWRHWDWSNAKKTVDWDMWKIDWRQYSPQMEGCQVVFPADWWLILVTLSKGPCSSVRGLFWQLLSQRGFFGIFCNSWHYRWDLNPTFAEQIKRTRFRFCSYGWTGIWWCWECHERGLQAHIRTQYTDAVYVHCRNRALNQVIVHSTKIPVIHNTLNTVQKILSFIIGSPKCLQYLLNNSSNKKRLQKFSDTHWSQHDMCLSTVSENYDDVLMTLVELKTKDGNAKCSSTASSLAWAKESFEFIICLIITQEMLH